MLLDFFRGNRSFNIATAAITENHCFGPFLDLNGYYYVAVIINRLLRRS